MAQETIKTKKWFPAIYARLSNEDMDSGKKGVSVSIEHQLDILRGFVESQGWQDPKVFCDDDRTGTNFNRKGFQDMYAEAKKGTINVIIIKDTSRFGRNWVQSGIYFESIEDMGIRFISIQEHLDTADPQCPALKMLPFYFIFNEWHSATTSEKIRTVFAKQAEQGKYRACQAPYGYDKDPDDKHKLVIDPYSANVVRRIFALRLQKVSFGAIADILNEESISCPSGYNAEKKGIENKKTRINKWSDSSVIGILDNPVYCGDVVHNRYRSESYKKQKAIRQPSENWITVKDMHEAIVSREDWQTCRDMRVNVGKVRSTKYKDVTPFTGLLICPECGYKMSRFNTWYKLASGDKKVSFSYNCSMYARKGKDACTAHYITEKVLKEIVISDIREKAGEVLQDENAARERFYAIKSQSSGTQLNHDRNALKKVNKRLGELDKLIQAAFEKSVLGGDSSDIFAEYAQKYEAEKQELTQQAKQLSTSIEKQSQTENDVDMFIALMKKYVNITDFDRATAVELIDHITVSASAVQPREIVIYYNFIGTM